MPCWGGGVGLGKERELFCEGRGLIIGFFSIATKYFRLGKWQLSSSSGLDCCFGNLILDSRGIHC